MEEEDKTFPLSSLQDRLRPHLGSDPASNPPPPVLCKWMHKLTTDLVPHLPAGPDDPYLDMCASVLAQAYKQALADLRHMAATAAADLQGATEAVNRFSGGAGSTTAAERARLRDTQIRLVAKVACLRWQSATMLEESVDEAMPELVGTLVRCGKNHAAGGVGAQGGAEGRL